MPCYLERAAVAIGDSTDITLSSLSLFASSTYTEVAILECAMALENGADEIVMPINIGAIKQGDIAEAIGRIEVIAEEISDSALLSIYIDNSKFRKFEDIKIAIDVAIRSGADTVALNFDASVVSHLREIADYLIIKNRGLEKTISLNIVIDGTIDNCKIAAERFIADNGLSELHNIEALRLSILL